MSTRVQAAASGPVMWDSHGRRKQLPSITQSSMTLDKVVEERDNTTLALERKRRKSRRHQRQTESRQSDVIRALISERRATVSTNQRPPFRPSISMTSSQFDDDVFSSSQRRASMLRTLASMDGGGGRSHDRPSLTSVKDELGCGVMTRLGLGREGYSRRPSKTRPGARFRKVARFVAVLFGLWRKHAVRWVTGDDVIGNTHLLMTLLIEILLIFLVFQGAKLHGKSIGNGRLRSCGQRLNV